MEPRRLPDGARAQAPGVGERVADPAAEGVLLQSAATDRLVQALELQEGELVPGQPARVVLDRRSCGDVEVTERVSPGASGPHNGSRKSRGAENCGPPRRRPGGAGSGPEGTRRDRRRTT